MDRPPEQRRRAEQRLVYLEPSTTTGMPAHAGQGVLEAAGGVASASEGPHKTTRFIRLQKVGGTADAQGTTVAPMGIDHGRVQISVAQQFLNRADVLAALQPMREPRRPLAL